jgi:CheY-like chemotaxis protein
VVDDEEFCISAISVLISRLGIDIYTQVDFCITGLEAVQKVKQIYSMGMGYKLILTDFNMPVMDGIKATYKIREYLN